MDLEVHFIDVGCGNMTLIMFPDGTRMMYDCNITDDNNDRVLAYLGRVIGRRGPLRYFVNSHRDADHMRGIKTLHVNHPISEIWDSGVPGTTTDAPEYQDYMDLRRRIPSRDIEELKYWSFGEATLRCMNSKDPHLSDANDQSIVFKVEHGDSSALLTGDTSFRPWKQKILRNYGNRVKSSILLAAHHGSISFFDDPADARNWCTAHIAAISPDMTLISVGPNQHGLPDDRAVKLYQQFSKGSDRGNKVYTTEEKGNMRLTLKQAGGWSLSVKQ